MGWRSRFARFLRRPAVIEGISLNDDFTNKKSDVRAILRERRPAWIGIQEGKVRDYRDDLPSRYGVVQRLRTAGTAGVAVIYDRRQVKPAGHHRDKPRGLGYGWQVLTPAGRGILTRGVAWRDVRVRGRLVRLASVHRPPWRARALWPAFDRALDAWVAKSPIPVWMVGDFNTPFARTIRVRGRKRLVRIDGHFIVGRLRFRGRPQALRKRSSDHRGIAALVHVRKP